MGETTELCPHPTVDGENTKRACYTNRALGEDHMKLFRSQLKRAILTIKIIRNSFQRFRHRVLRIAHMGLMKNAWKLIQSSKKLLHLTRRSTQMSL